MATHSCSCLENPGDVGAWWAAVYGVAQSRTRLKCLSSSSCYQNRVFSRQNCDTLIQNVFILVFNFSHSSRYTVIPIVLLILRA